MHVWVFYKTEIIPHISFYKLPFNKNITDPSSIFSCLLLHNFSGFKNCTVWMFHDLINMLSCWLVESVYNFFPVINSAMNFCFIISLR